MKYLLLALAFLFSCTSFSQEISREKGRFYLNGQQLSTRETRQLLTSDVKASILFKKAKNKESIGGLLIGVGAAAVTVDLAIGLFSDVKYPTVATYVGVAALLVSIPVLSGKNKKIDAALDSYNKSLKNTGANNPEFELNVIANQNGYGVQLKF